MLLGCKVHPGLFNNPVYRGYLNNFDVWYANSDVYEDLQTLDRIYDACYGSGKQMHGYYLLSSRWFIPKYKNFGLGEIRKYVRGIIERYPLIENWELCHEAITDDGYLRSDIYHKNFGKGWLKTIYKIAKNEFPDKRLYYSDYIRGYKKADYIIDFVNNTKEVDGFNFQCHSDIIKPLSKKFISYIYKNINKDIVSLENVVWQLQPNNIDYTNFPKGLINAIAKKGAGDLLKINPGISERIQAYRYKQYLDVARKYNIKVFGIWCLTDIKWDSWEYRHWNIKPGLLDDSLKPKLCYKRIFS